MLKRILTDDEFEGLDVGEGPLPIRCLAEKRAASTHS